MVGLGGRVVTGFRVGEGFSSDLACAGEVCFGLAE